jgi:hypothetical protein
MRKFGLLSLALVMIAAMFDGRLSSEAKADVWLLVGARSGLADHSSELIVKVKKKKKKHDDGGTTQPGERSCPVGYVVLEKPNKYGSFCEPKEGLPKTKQQLSDCNTIPKSAEQLFRETCRTQKSNSFVICSIPSPDELRCCCNYQQ